MNVDELSEELAAFGVEGNEAEAYFHLSRLGEATASELARAADLPRTDVYRLMDALEQKGLIERSMDSPTRFIPYPIDEALDRLLSARERETGRLEELRDELAQAWPQAEARSAPESERLSIQKGREQVEGLLDRLIRGARDQILVVCPKRSLARFESMGVLDALADRTEEGVDAKVLTEVDGTNRETAERYADVCDVRHLDLPAYLQMVVADADQIALFVAVDPLTSVSGSGLTALRLTSQDFILAQEALFDQLWDQALALEDRERELDTGVPAPRAQVVRGRWLFFEKLEELVHRADETIDLALGDPDLERPGSRGLGDLLARRAKDDVDLRVLTVDPDRPRTGEIEPGVVDSWPFRAELVIDDAETLRVLAGSEGAGPWALWSTLAEDVQRSVDRFEEAPPS